MSAGAAPVRRYHAPCPTCEAGPEERIRTRTTDEDGQPAAVVACGACGHELGRWTVTHHGHPAST